MGEDPQGITVSPDGKRAYVANQFSDTVSVIDVATKALVATWTTGAGPDNIEVSLDSKTVYVTNSTDGTVSALDATTGKDLADSPISVGDQPLGLALSPDGKQLVVATSANGGSVAIIDTTDLSQAPVLVSGSVLGASFDSVVISADGSKAYATDSVGGYVSIFSLGMEPAELQSVSVGSSLLGVELSSDSKTLYAAESIFSQLYAISLTADGLMATAQDGSLEPSSLVAYDSGLGPTDVHRIAGTPYLSVVASVDGIVQLFNTTTNTFDKSIDVGSDADSAAAVPGTTTIFVSNPSDGTVAVVDSSVQAAAGYGVGNLPVDIAAKSDGTYAYVLNQDDQSVSFLNMSTGQVSKTVYVGFLPQSIVISPDNTKLYVANNGDGTISVVTISTAKAALLGGAANPTSVDSPYGMAISPDGKTLYVANNASDTVTAYDTTTGAMKGDPFMLDDGTGNAVGPTGVVLSSDGNTLYVANNQSDSISQLNVSTGAVATWATGGGPIALALSPDGKTLYSSNSYDESVSSLSAKDGSSRKDYPLPAGSAPEGLQVIGGTLAVTLNGADALALMKRSDLGADPLLADVGTAPLAVMAVGAKILVVNNGDNTVSVLGAPNAPSSVLATNTTGGINVSWTPSDLSAGVPTDRYTATSTPDGLTCTVAAPATNCKVTGVKASTSYTFTVTASSALGTSDASEPSSSVTTPGKPGSPTGLSVTPGIGSLRASWTAPSSDGGSALTGYTATAYNVGKFVASCTAIAPLKECTITGLSATILYSVSVVASNAIGDSLASNSASGTPLVQTFPPSAPTGVKATARNQAVTISWEVPADGGLPISGYTATVYDGDGKVVSTCKVTLTICKITGLTNSTSYTATVLATNANGNSPESSPVAFTPTGPPTAPSNAKLASGDGQLVASWDAASADPLNPVSSYTVTLSPGGAICTSRTLTCTVTGLTNGTSYTATVVATNSAGDSPASSASAPEVPAGLPGQPGAPLLKSGDGVITAYWNAPNSSNGSAITGYTLKIYQGATLVETQQFPAGKQNYSTSATNGKLYYASVSATNAVGTGAASSLAGPVLVAGRPGRPSIGSSSGANRSINVAWTPGSDNGTAITGYAVRAYDKTGALAGTGCIGGSDLRSCTITGLANGSAYLVKIEATNAMGAASYDVDTITPLTTPGSPTSLVALAGNQQIEATWVAPADTGGSPLTGYTATAYNADGSSAASCTTADASSTTCVIAGLTNGTAYTVKVVATSSVGSSAPSTASPAVTPATKPGVPQSTATSASSRSIKVSWQAPASDGGAAVTSYLATATPVAGSAVTCKGAAGTNSCVISGLTNGTTYAVTLLAVNRVGNSSVVDLGSATPLGAPAAPTAVLATAGDATASVAFTAPADDGGSAITGYVVTAYLATGATAGSCTPSGTDTSCSVSSLTNGTAYTFRVVATNAVGSSVASAPSAVVTPVAVQTAPSAPQGVTASAGDASIAVAWLAPASTGGPSISGYTATAYGTSGAAGTCRTDGATSCTITGLANGTSYTVKVSATNSVGTGPEAAAKAVAPKANIVVPGSPSALKATAGAGQLSVSWTAPASNGGATIVGSTVTALGTDGSSASCTTTGTATACTIYGLTNGVAYTLSVASANSAGSGPASATATATPFTVPNAPSISLAVAGNASAIVAVAPPVFDGGSSVTGYTVTANPGGKTCKVVLPALSCTVSGLTNGTSYTLTAVATNAAGSSAASAASDAVIPSTQVALPGAPSAVSATAGNASAVVSWTAPDDQGGTAVVATYTAKSSSGKSCTVTAPSTSCNVVGLTNGTPVTFTVTASNAKGVGPASGASTAVTPVTVPSAPDAPKVLSGEGQLTVYWSPPASDGGAPVLYYVVIASLTDGSSSICVVAKTSCSVTGLVNGDTYAVTVAASNVAGSGPASTATNGTPVTVPGAPASVTYQTAPRSVLVAWSAPASNGGTPITGYDAEAKLSDGSTAGRCAASASSTSCTIGGLTNGTSYDLSVVASNRIGGGDAAFAASKATPLAAPAAPTGAAAVAGDGEIAASWTLPADVGGTPLISSTATAYTATGSAAGTCTTNAPASRCTITGLTNGTSYTIRVTSLNAVGASPSSSDSAAVAPQPAPTAPSAPRSVSAAAGDGAIGVSWSAPSSSGGPAITGYTATAWTRAQDGTRVATGFCSTDGTASSCTITGLTNGSSYVAGVVASNKVGGSPVGTSQTVTPKSGATAPGAPTGLRLTASPGQVLATWTAPTSNGGAAIIGSTATAVGADGSAASCTAIAAATSCVITGLANGVTYSVVVASANAMGSGPASNAASAVPFSAPEAPTIVTTSAGNGSVLIVLAAPASNGGSTITGYTVTSNDAKSCSVALPALSCTITGLNNGTAYTFTAKAANAAGQGPASAESDPVTPSSQAALPGAPTAVTAAAGDAAASVSWTAPDDQGGTAVPASYTAKAVGTKLSCSVAVPSTTCNITGLTNGTAYTFTVTATNAKGTGSASTASTAVTPATVPGAPTAVRLQARPGTLGVSWTAPVSNGGSPLVGSVAVATGTDGSTGECSASAAYTSCTFASLTDGVAYTVTVSSANALGLGAASTPVKETPYRAPDAPYITFVSAGNGSALVSVAGPAFNGGMGPTAYLITANPGPATCRFAPVPGYNTCTLKGLVNGTSYTFTVQAVNPAGTSPPSSPSQAVIPSTSVVVPTAPTDVSANAGDASAEVRWTPGDDKSSTAVAASFTAKSASGKSCTVSAPATSCTVKGLTNGTAQTFTVTATNAKGTGPASAASTAVTPMSPYTVPTPPQVLSLSPGDHSVAVTVGAPDDDGGKAVASTTVTLLDPSGLPTSACKVAGDSGSCTAKGLENGVAYVAVAFATNEIGNSPTSPSSDPATPFANPSAPTGTSARPGDHQVVAYWVPPVETGGYPITSYTATAYDATDSAVGTCTPVDPADATCTITGLENGLSYTVDVIAETEVGTSPSSNRSSAVLTAGAPSEPSNVVLDANPSSLVVRWDAPADPGGVALISSTATLSGDDGSNATCYAELAATSCVATDLTPGVTYTATVVARNPVGFSPDSAESSPVTVLDHPSQPLGVTASGADGAVNVSWTAPEQDGGSPITGYTARLLAADGSDSGESCTAAGDATSCTVDGLANGGATYTAVVVATNEVGDSPDSAPSSPVSPVSVNAKPGAPKSLTGTGAPGAVQLVWLAPDSSGGPAITSYKVCQTTPVGSCATVGLANLRVDDQGRYSWTATGLVNKTAYGFTVSAVNSVGTGPASLPSAPAKPKASIGAPGVPTNVIVLSGASNTSSAFASVSWGAPTTTGKSAITGYHVTAQDQFGTDLQVGCDTITTSCTLSFPASVAGLVTPSGVVPLGSPITLVVQAVNAAGMSSADDPTAWATYSPVIMQLPPVVEINFLTVSGPSTGAYFAVPPGLYNTVLDGVRVLTVNVWGTFSGNGTKAANEVLANTSIPNPDGGIFVPIDPAKLVGIDPASIRYSITASAGGVSSTATTGSFSDVYGTIGQRHSNAAGPPPNAPTGVIAAPGDGITTVTWTASDTSDGSPAPLYYTVTANPGGKTCVTTRVTCTIKGLTNGSSYTFTVRANGANANSAASDPSDSVTPYSPFSVPTSPTVTSTATGNGTIRVNFSAPADDGGKPITGYVATASPGGRRCTVLIGEALHCTIKGLTNGGTYTVTLEAINAIGAGMAANAGGLRPHAVAPVAPAKPTVVALDAAVTVAWTVPTDNGGSPISGYRVSVFDSLGEVAGSCQTTSLVLTCRVDGLANNASYTAIVKATNLAGVSLASAESDPVNVVPANITSITCLSEPLGTCIAVGTTGSILTTTDSGASWSREISPVATDLNSVTCPTNSTCVAVGAGGKVITTNDLVNWTLIKTPTKAALNDVACKAPSSCVAVGAAGAAVVTSDLHAWALAPTNVTAALSSVDCTKNCIAVGKTGTVIFSKDKGLTWTPAVGAVADLRSLACSNTKLCLAVGKAGAVYSLTKGGAVVKALTATGSKDLTAISCMSTGTCMAVGTSGFRYVSIDGGVTFVADSVGAANDLLSISAIGTESFVVGGVRGFLTATSNAGVTWVTSTYPS